MSEASNLTLSIVSHGHRALLQKLLGDVRTHQYAGKANIIVTLNLADEDFDSSAFPELNIQIIRNPAPKGFGANHNAALSRCKTDWFAILNPDLRLECDPFPALFEAVDRNSDVTLLAPRVLGPGGEIEDSVRENLTPLSLIRRRIFGRRAPASAHGPVRLGRPFVWFAGMFLLVRTDHLRALEGFDEHYFMYCEDFDLCARLFLSGRTMLQVPEATVVHHAQRHSHRALRPLLRHLRSLLRVWTSTVVWRVG